MTEMPDGQRKPDRDRPHDVQMVVMALAVFLLTWFVVTNTQKVHVQFWFFATNVSLIVVIVVSAILGALTALLLSATSRRRASKRAKRN